MMMVMMTMMICYPSESPLQETVAKETTRKMVPKSVTKNSRCRQWCKSIFFVITCIFRMQDLVKVLQSGLKIFKNFSATSER